MTADCPRTGPGSALVVDDSPDINRLIAFRLQRRGFEVSTAATGEDALEQIWSRHPDFVFLDISMPGMSGLDVLQAVRAEQLDTAIVIMTAFGSEQLAADAMRRGADDYLRKPFETDDFNGVVERVVARLELRRRNVALERELDLRRRQLETELARAAVIQADLLPSKAPVVPGYHFEARCIPAREVGGDFYYWAQRGDGQVDIAFGDVMGKGMPAALLMATVRAALRAALPNLGLADAMNHLASVMDDDLARSGSFVTMFAIRLDPGTGTLRYVDAGHGLAASVTPSGVSAALTGAGLPLGLSFGSSYEERTVEVAPGAGFVVFSDGVIDVRPELLDGSTVCLPAQRESSASGLVAALLPADRTQQEDDITVLAIYREATE